MSRNSEDTNLLQYLCQNKKVLTIGDVVLHKFVYTSSECTFSEAAISEDTVSYVLGGAGNVALNLQNLGIKVSLVSPVDTQGLIYKLLIESGISTEALLEGPFQDQLKTHYIKHPNYRLCKLESSTPGPDTLLPESTRDQIHAYLKENLTSFDCLILSEHEGGFLSEEFVKSVIQSARKVSIPVLVDPGRGQYFKFHGATLIKLNLEDAGNYSHFPITDADSKLRALKQIHEKLQIKECVLGLPKVGLVFSQDDKLVQVGTAKDKNIVSTTGSENAMVACLAFGIIHHLSLLKSCQLAHHAARSIIVEQELAPLNLVEVLKQYSKVVTSPQQERLLGEILRKNQQKVVFMSGCFDLIHRGHINILRRAKEQGDILVVGLNSDSSIKLNKGDLRPILSLEDRLEVLKAIHYCDFVIVFHETSPAKILDTLQPHVLVKGDDHSESHVRAMFPQMQNLAILPRTPGISTTDVIHKLTQLYRT